MTYGKTHTNGNNLPDKTRQDHFSVLQSALFLYTFWFRQEIFFLPRQESTKNRAGQFLGFVPDRSAKFSDAYSIYSLLVSGKRNVFRVAASSASKEAWTGAKFTARRVTSPFKVFSTAD